MRSAQYRIGLLGVAMLTACSVTLSAQWGQTQRNRPGYSAMSGTYELESTRGGDPRRAADTATRSLPQGQRGRAYQTLLARLEPPQTFSIDRNGRTITIASSRGRRSSFDADGQTRTERGPNGHTVSTRSQISGNQLTVSTSGGSRDSDFSVTFETLNNGDNLRVTRRLDDEDLARPVTIQSYYRRTSDMPRWDVYEQESEYDLPYGPRSGYYGSAVTVQDGTRFEATLDTPLSMRTSRDGDPFAMTVRSPAEFRNARIDGVISRVDANRQNENGTDMRVDFQTIQLGGRSSDFAAILNSVRLNDGTLLQVNADGDVQNVDRRDTRVQNGAIGAALGAVIGALAGGGKGAAVGAVVGGTGGVILSRGRDQLELQRGADVTLTAVAPSRYR